MAAFSPLPIFRLSVFIVMIGLAALTGPLLLPTGHACAATIVLDPGHGGSDTGARGGGKFTEKQFTLALSQKIASRLEARHRIEMTRTADIAMTPSDRAAVANHLGADLMLSLHGAVAPYCGRRSAAVFYHSDERLSFPSGMLVEDTWAEVETDRPRWSKLQSQHRHQSQNLAMILKQSLGDGAAFDDVTASGLPLAPLMGADLPAVLLELGCFHPAAAPDAQTLEQQLEDYAQSIAAAIETAVIDLER